MILFEFLGWNGFSARKGFLKGRHKNVPLTTYRLGFIVITRLSYEGKRILMEAMSGLADNDDWLIDNSEEVRKAIRQGLQKEIARDKDSLREQLASERKLNSHLREKNIQIETENHTLRQALKALK